MTAPAPPTGPVPATPRPEKPPTRRSTWFGWMPTAFLSGMLLYVAGSVLNWTGVALGAFLSAMALPVLLFSLPWAVIKFYRYFRDQALYKVRSRILLFYVLAGIIPLLTIVIISVITLYFFFVNVSIFIYDNEMKALGYRLDSLSSELMKTVADNPDVREDSAFLHYAFSSTVEKRAPDLPSVHIMFYTLDETGHMHYLAVQSSLPPADFQNEYLPDWLQQTAFTGVALKHNSAFVYSHNPFELDGTQYFLDVFIPFEDDLYKYLNTSAGLLSYATIERQVNDARAGKLRSSFKPFNGFGGAPTTPAQVDTAHNISLLSGFGGGGRTSLSTVDTIHATDWFNREHPALATTGKALTLHLRIPFATVMDYLSSRSYAGQTYLRVLQFFMYFLLVVEFVSVAAGVFTLRALTRSLRNLQKGTQELRKGNFNAEIPVQRRDELGVLSESFNSMATSVRALLIEAADKQRIRRELEIARDVQQEFFPKRLPQIPNLSLLGKCFPAREVSGDFYDFIVRAPGTVDVLVGDISGKGISAALLMASLQSASRAQPPLEGDACSPAGTVRQLTTFLGALNAHLFDITPEEKFATLFYARICLNEGLLFYCNAGHENPVLVHRDGRTERLETGGTILGIFPETDFEIGTVQLQPGDLLAVYTDGIAEAENRDEEPYGDERLMGLLAHESSAGKTLEALHGEVVADVMGWFAGVQQHDDITLVLVRFEGPADSLPESGDPASA